jgi:Winged helix DNA-binding domain
MRTVGVSERRARLALRHHLAPDARSDDVVQIAGDLLGLHATDTATVYLAAIARMATPDIAPIENALYEDRSVVRMLGMRRTMFVVPTPLVPVVHEGCTRDIAAKERRRTVKFLDESHLAEITDDRGEWLRRVEKATLAALVARGAALPAELAEDVPELREQIEVGKDTRWPTTIGMSSRVLFLLAADGHIVRGRPRGSWISRQYRWAPMRAWLDHDPPSVPAEAARVDLARRWLRGFGPGTFNDLRWWTGWTATQVKKTLAQIAPVEVDLGGATGLMLEDDVEPAPGVAPWAGLLPALDPTTMGWTERDWYLGAHRPALFDRNGNAGPTIWWDGHIVGGWAQRRDGQIATRLLEDVGSDAQAAIGAEVERLQSWLGDKRFTPQFRTPLERELSA